jgi:hypothetical protein
MPEFYKLNAPDVSAETFDQEIIAVNLNTGHYHSMRDVACLAWTLLTNGHAVEQTVTKLALAYPEQAGAAASDLRRFVDELVAAHLVVPAAASSDDRMQFEAPSIPGAYAQPILESYTDMQALLLIDPIHEVDILQGWPQQPGDTGVKDNLQTMNNHGSKNRTQGG